MTTLNFDIGNSPVDSQDRNVASNQNSNDCFPFGAHEVMQYPANSPRRNRKIPEQIKFQPSPSCGYILSHSQLVQHRHSLGEGENASIAMFSKYALALLKIRVTVYFAVGGERAETENASWPV